MTVYFIGAGPGAPDLITLRGLRLIQRCPVILYAGSLVPRAVLEEADPSATVINTAPLHLDQIIGHIQTAHAAGHDVARVHSGDPSLYGAIGEQIRRLDALGIAWEIVPGVPAFAAAAATLGRELTLPAVAQTVILTRTATHSSAMPPGEDLTTLGRSGATLVLHLSIKALDRVVRELEPLYGAECPVAVVYRASWPDETVLRGTLATIRDQVAAVALTRTALIVVGRVLDPAAFADSALYAAHHHHVLRPKAADESAD